MEIHDGLSDATKCTRQALFVNYEDFVSDTYIISIKIKLSVKKSQLFPWMIGIPAHSPIFDNIWRIPEYNKPADQCVQQKHIFLNTCKCKNKIVPLS